MLRVKLQSVCEINELYKEIMLKGIKISQMPIAETIQDDGIIMITQDGQNEVTTVNELSKKVLGGNTHNQLMKILSSQAYEITQLKYQIKELNEFCNMLIGRIEKLEDKTMDTDIDSITCDCKF